jgi:glycosyltransferase involved in cell wall biosynthesis
MTLHRILISINVRWWNAEAAYAVNLARGLTEKGINVWLIVNPGSPVQKKAEYYGLQVITDVLLDSHSPLIQLRNLRLIRRHISRKRIQVINSFKSNGAFLFSIVRRLHPGLGYIKTRGVASPPGNHWFNRYLYGPKSCDGVIAVGSKVHTWIRELLGDCPQHTTTIFYGDSPILKTASDQSTPGLTPKIPEGHFVLALLGRTQRVKGHMLLLEAFKLLKNKPLHLIFLVKDLEEYPDVLEEIRHYTDKHQLQERITILGFQKDLGAVMAKIDCGVIPSLSSEVNCRVCVEFFSAEIPVITFPTGTLPDIVSHGKNGYLCREHTVSELVRGIEWMLEHPAEFNQAKKKALEDYRTRFTLESLATETMNFYQTCKIIN